MACLNKAIERLESFQKAAEKIGVGDCVLSYCSPGTPYSTIRRMMSQREIELVLAGLHHLKGLYDEGNLAQMKNALQIASLENQGIPWKSVKRKR